MFLFRLMSYLFGHVLLIVQGKSLEKFINMAASRGIYLWDITRLGPDKILVRARVSGVKPLRHVARGTGNIFKIRSREGIPFILARVQRRKMMVVGATSFIIVLYALSSFIWFIDVSGNQKITTKEILKVAHQGGLSKGALKWNVDAAMVERIIKDQLPTVSWVGVYIKGTNARIEIVEKKMPGGADEHQPAHIVATKAGLVKDILVLSGQASVQEGDTVLPGQILISGEVLPETDPNLYPETGDDLPAPILMPRYVHAKGMVRARVWYEGYGEALLMEQGTKPSGQRVEQVSIKIGDKEIILKGPKQISLKQYKTKETVKTLPKWRNIAVPVELINVQYIELVDYREERTLSEARQMAEQNALSVVQAKLPKDAKILEQRIERIATGQQENVVRVKVFLEALEEIGTSKSFQP